MDKLLNPQDLYNKVRHMYIPREPTWKGSYGTQANLPPFVQCSLHCTPVLVEPGTFWDINLDLFSLCTSLYTLSFLRSAGGVSCLGEELTQKKKRRKERKYIWVSRAKAFENSFIDKNHTYFMFTTLCFKECTHPWNHHHSQNHKHIHPHKVALCLFIIPLSFLSPALFS